jgi:hypothetical protein
MERMAASCPSTRELQRQLYFVLPLSIPRSTLTCCLLLGHFAVDSHIFIILLIFPLLSLHAPFSFKLKLLHWTQGEEESEQCSSLTHARCRGPTFRQRTLLEWQRFWTLRNVQRDVGAQYRVQFTPAVVDKIEPF